MTSNKLISAIKRKISFPISQQTFTENEILDFANEEMFISQVPDILKYHEEYFVFTTDVQLVPNKTKYAIPDRAIGMRLRDLFYTDANNNVYEMTRINAADKAIFDRNTGSDNSLAAYYLENNSIVLTPNNIINPTGFLRFNFFLRPNQLVLDERASIISGFRESITVTNASLVAGDTVIINKYDDDVLITTQTFTAVAAGATGNQFNIGSNSTETASNIVTVINTNGITTASETAPASAQFNINFTDRQSNATSSSSTALFVEPTIDLIFTSIPTGVFVNGSVVDILQTKPGHKTYNYDVTAQIVSGTTMRFNESDIPGDVIVGDYVCLANESIIPQIPPDLHNGLAERASARILAAIGDNEGLTNANQKISQIETSEGRLLDQRVDGSPIKVVNRRSLLRSGKFNTTGRS